MSSVTNGEKKRLPLAELINLVGDEIIKANAYASGRKEDVLVFVECEVEVSFEVESEANGKVSVFAVEIGARGNQTTAHRLKVKYEAFSKSAFLGAANVE